MNEHLKDVLDEMARRVGLKSFSEVDSKDPKWTTKHVWTKKQHDSYVLWLAEYLLNPTARTELMNGGNVLKAYNSKKERRLKFARYFTERFGWRVVDNRSEKPQDESNADPKQQGGGAKQNGNNEQG